MKLLCTFLGLASIGFAQQASVDFSTQVFPLFERSCVGCHGPAKQSRGLRMDATAQVSAVLTPGKPAESELYRRVAGLSDGPGMPLGSSLASEDVELIRRWIAEGASWPAGIGFKPDRHWAFVPPIRSELPSNGEKHPIDAFVRQRLDSEGLSPSPPADEITLLRRLSLDLIGLPPTIEEIDAYLANRDYADLIERLLASPHYGERWARPWLDGARYADSDGYEKDMPREVWFYRDWVVNAFNGDMPYDRFIIEQLAGDLLPNPTQDQIVATGYLRNSMINEEGGTDPEQFRMEAMFDRMDAIGKGILGLTIQCAQCHSHRYDPLTHEEYYQLFSFLNNSDEARVAVYTPEEQRKRAEVLAGIREIEDDLMHRTPDWKERKAAWEVSVRNDQPEWVVLRPEVNDVSTGGQRYVLQDDDSLLAQGYAPTEHTVELTARTDIEGITAFRLELLNDPNLPLGGPGRSIFGTGALTEFKVEAAPASDPEKKREVWIRSASADVNPLEKMLDPEAFPLKDGKRLWVGPIDFAYDDCAETAWHFRVGPGRNNQPREAVFVAGEPISYAGGTVLKFFLNQSHGGYDSNVGQTNNLGRIRLSVTTAADDPVADSLPAAVREIFSRDPSMRAADEQRRVFSYWRTTIPEWKAANERIEKVWSQYPRGSTQLVLDEREAPRMTSVLERGDFLKPNKPVQPGAPAFLNPLSEGAAPTRLTFAKWLTDRKAPTTARSIVNRIWQAYFGTGLVATPEDLGAQGDAPSHPKLLDWLAVELMENDWSLKHLHRLIVTSKTYQQTSRQTAELRERDPNNRLLARGPRLRVDAEIVRDIALTASGLLNRTLGGPPVYPPAPAVLFKPPISFAEKPWPFSTGEDRYRRALYTFRYIASPYPVFETFDAPNGATAGVRRGRSNTPLQALTTLNEEVFLAAARALGAQAAAVPADDEARLQYVFRSCLTRLPRPEEARRLLELLDKQKRRIDAGDLDARELAGDQLKDGAQANDVAAWTALSRVLLNLDETITKQ